MPTRPAPSLVPLWLVKFLPKHTITKDPGRLTLLQPTSRRNHTNGALSVLSTPPVLSNALNSSKIERSALGRLPTLGITRSLLLGSFFTIPILFTPGFALMKKVATSQSFLLNPDKNPLVEAVIKPLIYDHFCAGTTRAEIQQSIARTKGLGFAAVISCYGKEINVTESSAAQRKNQDLANDSVRQEVEWWKKGNL